MSDLFAGRRARLLAPAALLLLLVLYPLLIDSDYRVFTATTVGIYLLVALGMNLLLGYGGQVSLGHAALLAIGAYTTAILTVDHAWPLGLALMAAAAVSAVGGALMALPGLRVSAWAFALVTLAFAEVVAGGIVSLEGLTGGFTGVIGVPPVSFGGTPLTPTELFWFVLALDVIAFVLVMRLVRSRVGRGLVAMREGGLAAEASGASQIRLKLFAFAASAALAGLGGGLIASQKSVVTPDDFTLEIGIFFVLVVVVGGPGRLWGPVVGTLIFFAVPDLMEGLERYRTLVYGAGLLLLMRFAPSGVVGWVEGLWQRLRARGRPPEETAPPPEPIVVDVPPSAVPGASLRTRGLTKRFGGVTALDGVELEVAPGELHGLIGPNGSGKTTLLNAISGFVTPDAGEVLLGDRRLRGGRPAATARRGIARTFQTPRLVPDLSVLDNVLLGAYARERATVAEHVLGLPRARRDVRETRERAAALLQSFGIGHTAELPAAALTHGHQRVAEIARALLADPAVLLLDEPAAGLSMAELDHLAEVLRAIAGSGRTVVLVEHHVELVRDLCATVSFLDRGRLIARGTPDEVLTRADVSSSYLGVVADVA